MMNQSQVNKHIFINNKDLGFWTQHAITAQRFEMIDGEPELVWCNHAGATDELETVEHPRIDQPDIVYSIRLMVCDKANCGAWKRYGDKWWEDAPFEGVTKDD